MITEQEFITLSDRSKLKRLLEWCWDLETQNQVLRQSIEQLQERLKKIENPA